MDLGTRYERQMLMDNWGTAGQEKLRNAHVGIAGVGGLGSPVATYLAAAGVGTLTLCDFQQLELSNLNRQILYGTGDVGRVKVDAAAERLSALNPEIAVLPRNEPVTDSSIDNLFGQCDLMLDCLDNMETRFVLNRYSVGHGMPLVHAGVREFYGQVMVLAPPRTACLECFVPPEADNEGPIPICGATAGVLGSLQATLALQFLLGISDGNVGVYFNVDLADLRIHRVAMKKRPGCRVCGD